MRTRAIEDDLDAVFGGKVVGLVGVGGGCVMEEGKERK